MSAGHSHNPERDIDTTEIRRQDIKPDRELGSGGYSRDQKRALWWIVGIIAVAIVTTVIRHEVMLATMIGVQAENKETLNEVRGDIKSLLRKTP